MDHELSPPWTLLNIAKAIKAGLLAQPSAQHTIEENIAYQMVNNRLTFQEQSWVPDAFKVPNWSLSPLQEQTIAR